MNTERLTINELKNKKKNEIIGQVKNQGKE
jgi:hypothetical protein